MRDPTIAKNYAEALVELARKASPNDLAKWGKLIEDVSEAMGSDRSLYNFLESPRVAASEKNRVIALALESQVPLGFLRFIQALVKNRRQMLIPEIAIQYAALVDEAENRVHASVTVARDHDEAERSVIASRLSKIVGKEVVAHYFVNPQILGGVVVRIGDTVMDGSVRRRLATLKARMLGGA